MGARRPVPTGHGQGSHTRLTYYHSLHAGRSLESGANVMHSPLRAPGGTSDDRTHWAQSHIDMFREEEEEGWQNGSVGRVLASYTQRPEFSPPCLYQARHGRACL